MSLSKEQNWKIISSRKLRNFLGNVYYLERNDHHHVRVYQFIFMSRLFFEYSQWLILRWHHRNRDKSCEKRDLRCTHAANERREKKLIWMFKKKLKWLSLKLTKWFFISVSLLLTCSSHNNKFIFDRTRMNTNEVLKSILNLLPTFKIK